MFSHLSLLNRALKKNRITRDIADKIAERRDFVWATDLQEFIKKDEARFSQLENVYFSSAIELVEVKRQNIVIGTGPGFVPQPSQTVSLANAGTFAFFCSETRAWYHHDDFAEVTVEGNTVCLTATTRGIWSWRDDTLHWSPESIPTSTGSSRSSSGNSIPGYHSQERPTSWNNRVGMGLENEVYCDRRGDFYRSLPEGILGETDGSLDHNSGIELIGGPYSLEEYQTGKSPWNDTCVKMKEFGVKGHNAGDNYGIHISVTRSMFTDLHLAKFVLFLNQQDRLCKLIAQRDSFYSGSYKANKKITDFASIDRVRERVWRKRMNSLGVVESREILTDKVKVNVNFGNRSRYEAASIGSRRVEVRIFKANTRWDRILKNLEFVDSVRVYTKLASSTSVVSDDGTKDYLAWLSANSGHYPALMGFLAECQANKKADKCKEVYDIKINKKPRAKKSKKGLTVVEVAPTV